MTFSHQEFLQQAVNLAVQNVLEGGGPFAALIVKNQQIIAAAGNQVTVNHDPTAHAEVMAIRAACSELQDFQLAGCTLYTSCEPCPMCLGAVYWARLSEVYFACNRFDAASAGFDDSFIYQQIPLSPEARQIPMHYLPLAGADRAFENWHAQSGKTLY